MAKYPFADWEKKDLVKYLEFLIHNYRVVDSFWYINVERDHGPREADRINELVWKKAAAMAAREIKAKFGLGGGLDGFVKAQRLFPWSILVGYDYEVLEDEVYLSVPHCPTQEARKERGAGEYACRAMHEAEFRSFAHEIDPRIEVECLYAPPAEHPADMYCRWRFYMNK